MYFSGELNDIASLISTIYLSAYAMLNLCTFHIAYFKPLGWRPTYKVLIQQYKYLLYCTLDQVRI